MQTGVLIFSKSSHKGLCTLWKSSFETFWTFKLPLQELEWSCYSSPANAPPFLVPSSSLHDKCTASSVVFSLALTFSLLQLPVDVFAHQWLLAFLQAIRSEGWLQISVFTVDPVRGSHRATLECLVVGTPQFLKSLTVALFSSPLDF